MQTGLMADVHLMLCGAVAGCALAVAAEAATHGTGAFAPTIARVFFTLLQGTWFFQAAHILYGACHVHALPAHSAACGQLAHEARLRCRRGAVGPRGWRQRDDAARSVRSAHACRRVACFRYVRRVCTMHARSCARVLTPPLLVAFCWPVGGTMMAVFLAVGSQPWCCALLCGPQAARSDELPLLFPHKKPAAHSVESAA
jgi:hypothetical protein